MGGRVERLLSRLFVRVAGDGRPAAIRWWRRETATTHNGKDFLSLSNLVYCALPFGVSSSTSLSRLLGRRHRRLRRRSSRSQSHVSCGFTRTPEPKSLEHRWVMEYELRFSVRSSTIRHRKKLRVCGEILSPWRAGRVVCAPKFRKTFRGPSPVASSAPKSATVAVRRALQGRGRASRALRSFVTVRASRRSLRGVWQPSVVRRRLRISVRFYCSNDHIDSGTYLKTNRTFGFAYAYAHNILILFIHLFIFFLIFIIKFNRWSDIFNFSNFW